MTNNTRQRAEILFRRGNERVEAGSQETDWQFSLSIMVGLLADDENLVHISGFQNFGLQGAPASLLTLTSKQLIIQLYPGGEVYGLPLGAIQEVSCHRDFLFQNNLHITTTSGEELKFAMEKDIAAPLERAINSLRQGGGA